MTTINLTQEEYKDIKYNCNCQIYINEDKLNWYYSKPYYYTKNEFDNYLIIDSKELQVKMECKNTIKL